MNSRRFPKINEPIELPFKMFNYSLYWDTIGYLGQFIIQLPCEREKFAFEKKAEDILLFDSCGLIVLLRNFKQWG